jgi:hypothetical protein
VQRNCGKLIFPSLVDCVVQNFVLPDVGKSEYRMWMAADPNQRYRSPRAVTASSHLA